MRPNNFDDLMKKIEKSHRNLKEIAIGLEGTEEGKAIMDTLNDLESYMQELYERHTREWIIQNIKLNQTPMSRSARKPFYTPMFMWNHFLLFAVNQNAPELDSEKRKHPETAPGAHGEPRPGPAWARAREKAKLLIVWSVAL